MCDHTCHLYSSWCFEFEMQVFVALKPYIQRATVLAWRYRLVSLTLELQAVLLQEQAEPHTVAPNHVPKPVSRLAVWGWSSRNREVSCLNPGLKRLYEHSLRLETHSLQPDSQ